MNDEMQKIALIINGIPDIQSKAVYQRATMLSRDYKVYIFAKYQVCESIAKKVEKVHYCPGLSLGLDKVIFPFWVLFNILIIDRRINIAYSVFSFNNIILISGFMCKMFGKIWIADLLDDPSLSLEKRSRDLLGYLVYIYQSVLYLIVKKVLHFSDLVIILKGMKEIMIDFNLDTIRYLEVTNGVDLQYIAGKVKYHKAEVLDNKFTIVYVGMITTERGIRTVIESAHLVSGEFSDMKYILIGWIPYQDDYVTLKALIDKYNLDQQFNIIGELSHEETMNYIKEADICLYPFPKTRQLEYVSPIKVFEYMAYGKVVIASRLKGVEDIIEQNDSGILVEPGNPRELANAIMMIYRDRKLKKKIELGALEKIKKFDWSLINNKILSHVKDVIDDINKR
ncbi:MAG: glycosyltransferase [Candidatus Thorarchaeota archaeon]